VATLLGIDVGGSGIKGAPVDVRTGELLTQRLRIPTPTGATPKGIADVVVKVARFFDWTGPCGLTVPAVVQQGIVRTAANIDPAWIGTDARSLFSRALDAPVEVLNDADAAGLGEVEFGAGVRRRGVVLMLTFGTGVGSALFSDGVLVPNTELGHLELRGRDAELRVSDRTRARKGLSWRQFADRVDEFLAMVQTLFHPDLVVIGGGVAKKADRFLPYLSTTMRVVPAALGNDAGIVGAAVAAARSLPTAGTAAAG
jgi:polyphosphate glucokinase